MISASLASYCLRWTCWTSCLSCCSCRWIAPHCSVFWRHSVLLSWWAWFWSEDGHVSLQSASPVAYLHLYLAPSPPRPCLCSAEETNRRGQVLTGVMQEKRKQNTAALNRSLWGSVQTAKKKGHHRTSVQQVKRLSASAHLCVSRSHENSSTEISPLASFFVSSLILSPQARWFGQPSPTRHICGADTPVRTRPTSNTTWVSNLSKHSERHIFGPASTARGKIV